MWHECLSYCFSYAPGSMSLRSLQIFSQERGGKHNVWNEKCGLTSEITFLSNYNLRQCGVFSVTKVCVCFYQWCLWKVVYNVFHHANMCLWLSWNSAHFGKKTNTLPKYDLNCPFQNAILLHWLFDGTAQTRWGLKSQKTNVKGAALELLPGL